ncbi:YveK family protein [Rothia nasimurium]|uniref:YveK family protein n=1 Tax=Rothia nasimurium TaxID=85336 RepID=UPI001F02855E|nr:Wzz/FepE/Etk N-terminal domain-containing protein [Rothia nasimurium]
MERSSRARANDQQATPISLGAAVRRILRHKIVVLISALIFAALGAVAGLALPHSYESKAVINVTQPSAGASGLRAALNSIDMDTEEAIASSRVVLQAAADELGMDVADLKDQVTAAGHSNSTILDIIVNAKDPNEAADIANTVARAYLAHRSDTLRASREETRENIDAVSNGMDKALVDQAILTLEATSTDSGTIISEAQVPDAPSNFSLAQTIFIGGAMGLLIGIFAAYVVDRTNRTLGYSERLSEISGAPVSIIARGAENESASQLLRRIGVADGRLKNADLRGITVFSPTPRAAASLTSLLTGVLTDSNYTIADAATFNALGLENLKDYIKQNSPVIIDAPASASTSKVLLAADHTRVLLVPFTSKSTVKSAQRLFDELTPGSSTQVIPVYFDTPTQK